MMRGRELSDADLQGLTPEQFERLTFLLARADEHETVIVRNHDRGLDARLPDPMGRLTLRGWQAKRFATGEVQWRQCEESVKTALAFWRPLWITFVFAHDLSATEQDAFHTRLVEAFPEVRLSFWSAEEVLRRMRETDEGQRAVAWLFDRQGSLDELLASLVDKEPVVGAAAIAERQAELNAQFSHDPHLFYTAVVRPEGAPETPPAPETVASVILALGGQEVRYDLSERYPGAFNDLGRGARIVASDDDRGRAAIDLVKAAATVSGKTTIEDGLGVIWPQVPVGLRGLVPAGTTWGAVEIGDAVQTPASAMAAELTMLVSSGDAQVGVGFVKTAADEGWDSTLVGATGGLELRHSFRIANGHIDAVVTRWRHTLGAGPATEQLLSARVLLSALSGEPIVFQVDNGGQAIASADEHDHDDQDVEALRIHVGFLEYACELQGWLGVPLFPPARPTDEDAAELGRALGLVRHPQREGTWTRIDVAERPDAERIEHADLAILQPVYVELFGDRHYLGMDVLQAENVTIDRSGANVYLLPTGDPKLFAELHHPDRLPADAASNYVGEGRGRILLRPATDRGNPS